MMVLQVLILRRLQSMLSNASSLPYIMILTDLIFINHDIADLVVVGEIIVDDGLGHTAQSCTVGGLFAVDGDGDDGVIGGGETDEVAVVRTQTAGLRSTGLAANLNRGAAHGITGGTHGAGDNLLHALLVGGDGFCGQLHDVGDLGLIFQNQGPVIGRNHAV